jgi:hypothetical protein
MAVFDERQGQELARPVSHELQIAEIAQIPEQFLIARKNSSGQQIGHPVKK